MKVKNYKKYLKIIIPLLSIFGCILFACCKSATFTIPMIRIPGKNYSFSRTEITQRQYKTIMKSNPSEFKARVNFPVENVSWYDAIVFCNKLSLRENLTPVYSVNGSVNPRNWGYSPGMGDNIESEVVVNNEANGYRLPYKDEWIFAAKGGENYKYPGSNDLSEVGWYVANSNKSAHKVATKKENGYGLYDMAGNVLEWVWESNNIGNQKFFMGGCWKFTSIYSSCNFDLIFYYPNYRSSWVGFRIAKNEE